MTVLHLTTVLPACLLHRCTFCMHVTPHPLLVNIRRIPHRHVNKGACAYECTITSGNECHLLCRALVGEEKEDGSKKAVIRPYTPVTTPEWPEPVGAFDLIIKRYPDGLMSKHIADMEVMPYDSACCCCCCFYCCCFSCCRDTMFSLTR